LFGGISSQTYPRGDGTEFMAPCKNVPPNWVICRAVDRALPTLKAQASNKLFFFAFVLGIDLNIKHTIYIAFYMDLNTTFIKTVSANS